MSSILKMNKRVFLISAACLVILLSYQSFSNLHSQGSTLWKVHREGICLEFLTAGTLYQGQAACGNGPFTYYLPWMLRQLFGNQGLEIMLFIIYTCIILLTFIMLLSMIPEFSILTIILYFILIIPTFFIDLAATLSTFFLFLAVWLIVHKKWYQQPFRLFFAGFITGMSLFTKMITLGGALSIFFILLIMNVSAQNLYKRIKQALVFLTGICTYLLLITLFHPNILTYLFTMTAYSDTRGNILVVIERIITLVFSNMYATQFLFMLIVSVIILFHDAVFGLFSLSIIIPWIALSTSYYHDIPLILSYNPFYYYFFFYLLAFIVGIQKVINTVQNKKARYFIISAILLWALYFPIIMGNAHLLYSKEVPDINAELKKPFVDFFSQLDFIEQEKTLVDKSIYNYLTPQQKQTVLINQINEIRPSHQVGVRDVYFLTGLARSQNLNSETNKILEDQDATYNLEVLKNVSMLLSTSNLSNIIIGPWPYSSIRLMPYQSINKIFDDWCVVYIPDFLHVRQQQIHEAEFLSSKYENCERTQEKLLEYYTQNFNTICSKDQFMATETKKIISKNNIVLDLQCTSGKSQFLHRTIKKTKTDAFMIITIFSLLAMSLFVLQRTPEKLKRITYIILIALSVLAMLNQIIPFIKLI